VRSIKRGDLVEVACGDERCEMVVRWVGPKYFNAALVHRWPVLAVAHGGRHGMFSDSVVDTGSGEFGANDVFVVQWDLLGCILRSQVVRVVESLGTDLAGLGAQPGALLAGPHDLRWGFKADELCRLDKFIWPFWRGWRD
jgi:hypothetical protein